MPKLPSSLTGSPCFSNGKEVSSASRSVAVNTRMKAGICLLISTMGRCTCDTSCRKAAIMPKVTVPSRSPNTPHRNATAYPVMNPICTIVRENTEKSVRLYTCPCSDRCSSDNLPTACPVYSSVRTMMRCCKFSCKWLCMRLSVSRISRIMHRIFLT